MCEYLALFDNYFPYFAVMNCVLIADSGSTKTTWCLLSSEGTQHAQTSGINPYLQSQDYITQTIEKELPSFFLAAAPQTIYFYGAGCSTSTKQHTVHTALQTLFTTSKIAVSHDLLAAARAACGKEKGIAAILGTGANSCYFDGKNIVENVASLGFILGDEGSGAYMGKRLMQLYLYNELDIHLRQALEKQYAISPEMILDSVYSKANPNRFLASFFEFIYANKLHPQMAALIIAALTDFITQHITKYSEHRNVPLNAVGSVAFLLKEELAHVAALYGILVGTIIKSPMEGLITYHQAQHD